MLSGAWPRKKNGSFSALRSYQVLETFAGAQPPPTKLGIQHDPKPRRTFAHSRNDPSNDPHRKCLGGIQASMDLNGSMVIHPSSYNWGQPCNEDPMTICVQPVGPCQLATCLTYCKLDSFCFEIAP
jgi:hypothetical protein